MNTTTGENAGTLKAETLKKVLEDEVWNAADRIGRPSCYYMLHNFTDAEMAGYAHGVHTALVCVAEELALGDLDTKQLDAALGERLHRKGGGKLACRRLNNLVAAIRAPVTQGRPPSHCQSAAKQKRAASRMPRAQT